ncbi:MAG: CRTAC1 family protein [Candidatus Solibacter usitatus]|nr:CRTAC1 family protein [Candidatus Solibacter usitatus]
MARALWALMAAALVSPAGLDFIHRHSPTPQKYLLETMGGGVALLDFDNDGLLDVFLVNGAELPSLRRDQPAYWNRLYRQKPDHTFVDVTERAGISQAGQRIYGMGVAAGDYDNDGYTDLYVTGYPRNQLFHNNGDGTFTDVTDRAGVAAAGWSASAGFFDFDNDGKLDLFVTRYLDWDLARTLTCGVGFAVYCNPDRFAPVSSILYRNLGDGRFRDVSQTSGIAAAKGKGLGVAFEDYDGDGFTDVFVANDQVPQLLFHNNRDGTFTECALDAGVALSDDGKTYAGMGADFGDYDNDGLPDLIVTNLATDVYALYHNEGRGLFRYTSLATGLGALSVRSSGWGVRWLDFDNDGWKDLFVAQSHVIDNIDRIDPSRRYKEPPALIRNAHGRFERAELPGALPVAGRGAAFGDLDNDGAMDVVMTALGERPLVFRGPPGKNHWLIVQLTGTRGNRDGYGAKVRINGQYGYATAAGSYLSSSDKRLHFGLGEAREARVEIRWPSGRSQIVEHAAVDRVLAVKEP